MSPERAKIMAMAKQAELQAERQRVEHGLIPRIRRPLIDKIYGGKRGVKGGTSTDNQ